MDRSQRLRSIHRGGNRDTQPLGVSSVVSLNEALLEPPEEVVKFAPKKVRDVGCFHLERMRCVLPLLSWTQRKHDIIKLWRRSSEQANCMLRRNEYSPYSVR